MSPPIARIKPNYLQTGISATIPMQYIWVESIALRKEVMGSYSWTMGLVLSHIIAMITWSIII
jgi:hypothetical protein